MALGDVRPHLAASTRCGFTVIVMAVCLVALSACAGCRLGDKAMAENRIPDPYN